MVTRARRVPAVKVLCGATGERRTVRCPRCCDLRELQKRICDAFGQDFLGVKAEILVDGHLIEKPFKVVKGTCATVWFIPTNDPFWLDVRDRPRPQLEGHRPSPLRN